MVNMYVDFELDGIPPPSFDRRTVIYSKWKRRLEVWLYATDVDIRQQAPNIIFHLDEDTREEVLQSVTKVQYSSKEGVNIVLNKLDEMFEPNHVQVNETVSDGGSEFSLHENANPSQEKSSLHSKEKFDNKVKTSNDIVVSHTQEEDASSNNLCHNVICKTENGLQKSTVRGNFFKAVINDNYHCSKRSSDSTDKVQLGEFAINSEKFGEDFSGLPIFNSNSNTEQVMTTKVEQGKERDEDPLEECQEKFKDNYANFASNTCTKTSMVKNIDSENEKLHTNIDKNLSGPVTKSSCDVIIKIKNGLKLNSQKSSAWKRRKKKSFLINTQLNIKKESIILRQVSPNPPPCLNEYGSEFANSTEVAPVFQVIQSDMFEMNLGSEPVYDCRSKTEFETSDQYEISSFENFHSLESQYLGRKNSESFCSELNWKEVLLCSKQWQDSKMDTVLCFDTRRQGISLQLNQRLWRKYH